MHTSRRHPLASHTLDPACATWNATGCREDIAGTSPSLWCGCGAGRSRRVADYRRRPKQLVGWHTRRPKGDYTRYGLPVVASFLPLMTCHKAFWYFLKARSFGARTKTSRSSTGGKDQPSEFSRSSYSSSLLQYWELSASCRSIVLSFASFRHLPLLVHHQQSGSPCFRRFPRFRFLTRSRRTSFR